MRPSDGLIIQWEKPNFRILHSIGPGHWVWGYEIPWHTSMIRLSTNRSRLLVLSACRPIEVGCRFSQGSANRSVPNILVTFGRKTSGWGGGWGCNTHVPLYQYWLSINRRVWGFGLTRLVAEASELLNQLSKTNTSCGPARQIFSC